MAAAITVNLEDCDGYFARELMDDSGDDITIIRELTELKYTKFIDRGYVLLSLTNKNEPVIRESNNFPSPLYKIRGQEVMPGCSSLIDLTTKDGSETYNYADLHNWLCDIGFVELKNMYLIEIM